MPIRNTDWAFSPPAFKGIAWPATRMGGFADVLAETAESSQQVSANNFEHSSYSDDGILSAKATECR